jgi:molybdopterin molybdotransferase
MISPMMLTLEEALERMMTKMNPLEMEEISINEADGRIISSALKAGISLPVWDNSAMDGYALQAADVKSSSISNPIKLKCLGEIPAGSTPKIRVTSGTCIRIFTGSPMPDGADAVVMQEDTAQDDEHPESIHVLDPVRPFENVRFRGEDIKEGTLICEPGIRLSPFQVALAAATGTHRCQVHRRPKVGILATGTELCEPGTTLTDGGIYESNRVLIQSLVKRAGCDPIVYPIVEDSLEATCSSLSKAADECDAIVTSGGVSVGDYDFIKPAIESLGGTIDFWRIRIKPGKPLVFGNVQSKPLFGLPGNPVSATVTFTLLVHPALVKLGGEKAFSHTYTQGLLAEKLENPGDRRLYLRMHHDAGGRLTKSGANQASHALGSLAASSGLVAVPESSELEAGSEVPLLLWPTMP